MPLIKNLKAAKEDYIESLEKRFSSSSKFEEGLKLYEVFRSIKKEVDDLRAERNRKTQEFAKTKDKKIIEAVKKIKISLGEKEAKLREVEASLRAVELTLPNWVNENVPVGKDDTTNVPKKYVGKPVVEIANVEKFKKDFPKVDFETSDEKFLHHAELVEVFGLADMETAAQVSGARFYIEKNELAILDLALSLHVMKEFGKLGFTTVIPPYMMKKSMEEKITYFTSFEESIYQLKDDDLILITTSEHPLAAMYQNTTLTKKEIPLRLVAFSPAFRREAGSHGRDTKGIFRAHHFNKVELHSIVPVKNEMEELEFLTGCVEKVMKPLEFPYRIVRNTSGDMDNRATLQYDLEAWFPAQNNFRELHSIATVGTWISEKLNTKVEVKGEKKLAANLYATGAAIQRTLLAIFVNNYNPKTKTITIPKPLREISGISEIKVKTI